VEGLCWAVGGVVMGSQGAVVRIVQGSMEACSDWKQVLIEYLLSLFSEMGIFM